LSNIREYLSSEYCLLMAVVVMSAVHNIR
jgi:hypothetical protein